MNEPLRPSNLGEILDRSLAFYRARFLVFFGIAVLPAGVVLAFASALFLFFAWLGSGAAGSVPPRAAQIFSWLIVAGIMLLALPICVAVSALGTAALNHAAARTYRDEKIAILAACKDAWKRGWRYLWLYFLQGLFAVVAPLVVFGGALLATTIASALRVSSADMLLGSVAIAAGTGFSVWFLLALPRLWLAFPVCVVEQTTAWAALRRGYRLSKGTRGRLFVLWLLGAALSRLLTLALAIPLMIVVELIPGANTPQHQDLAGAVILFILVASFFAVQALTRPVYAIALLLFYYDQRIRQEAFDIEWLMQRAGMEAEAKPEAEAAPWPSPISEETRPVEEQAQESTPPEGEEPR
ncbi:MAG: hypothetical protein ABSE87_14010 [Terracidiphilus sp.]|jgi:hypothetical protein